MTPPLGHHVPDILWAFTQHGRYRVRDISSTWGNVTMPPHWQPPGQQDERFCFSWSAVPRLCLCLACCKSLQVARASGNGPLVC